MGAIAKSLEFKLMSGLSPTDLQVVDDSARHAGHAGANAAGESHFNVTVTSAAFSGLNRVQRQRLVYGLLADELAGAVHALSLTTRAPGEG